MERRGRIVSREIVEDELDPSQSTQCEPSHPQIIRIPRRKWKRWVGPEPRDGGNYRGSLSEAESSSDEGESVASSSSTKQRHVLESSARPHRRLRDPRREFRLLILDGAASKSAVECQLLHEPMATSLTRQYETVSYCWGSLNEIASLKVDGIRLDVPRSAVDALRRLRHPDRSRIVWIDAICIDQSNVGERSEQVAQMHLIYKNAARNLIWLGEDDGTAAQGIEAVQLLKREIDGEMCNAAAATTFRNTVRSRDGRLRYASSGLKAELDWDALLNLFSREWFTRMWVVQEASLAASNLCHCGPYEFDLVDTLKAAQWLYYKRDHLKLNSTSYQKLLERLFFSANLSNFVDPTGWYRTTGHQRSYGNLLALLESLTQFQARDPRDHVFGLLGLYRHVRPEVILPASLSPDYSKLWPEVFRDATRFCIQETRTLDALAWTRHRLQDAERPEGMPSWVPSWHRRWDAKLDEQDLARFFEADGGRSMTMRESSNAQVLSLKGFYVGDRHAATIAAASGICSNARDLSSFLEGVEALIHERDSESTSSSWLSSGTMASLSPKSVANEPGSGDTIDHASPPRNWNPNIQSLAATLSGGRNPQNEPSQPADVRGYEALQNYQKQNQKLPPTTRVLRLADQPHDQETWDAAGFLDAIWRACARRRFFITRAGDFGLGPQTLQPGDVVAVMYAGTRPFVLRPEGDAFRLVGYCYLHGSMYGEAVPEQPERGRRDVMFDLV